MTRKRLNITLSLEERLEIEAIKEKTGLSLSMIVNKLMKRGLEEKADVFYFYWGLKVWDNYVQNVNIGKFNGIRNHVLNVVRHCP